jgi:hypothetical protein
VCIRSLLFLCEWIKTYLKQVIVVTKQVLLFHVLNFVDAVTLYMDFVDAVTLYMNFVDAVTLYMN